MVNSARQVALVTGSSGIEMALAIELLAQVNSLQVNCELSVV